MPDSYRDLQSLMDSTTLKKTKIRRTGLCDLPDEILVNIMSLLPTKFAITTSLLLSRRWHYLWTFITNLKLSQDMFKESSQFINFVDRAMDLRKGSSLKSFSLRYRVWSDDDASRVNAWITSAVQCNVVQLALKIDPLKINRLLLPVCLLDCQSLEKLELIMKNGILSVSVPSSSSSSCSRSVFPNLKSLSLCGVTFGDHESAQKLLSCPLLEELSIKSCNWCKVRAISLTTPNLKVLDIEDNTYAIDYEDVNRKVCFVADKLCSFCYSGFFYNEYQICASDPSQLINAKVCARPGDFNIYASRCLKLMNGLSKARSLTLENIFVRAFKHIIEQIDTIPVFKCLTRLNVERNFPEQIGIDCFVLMKICEKCPRLERLDITSLKNVDKIPLLNSTPACFRTCLKRIYIGTCYYGPFKSKGKEEDIISVLLNNCAVLEILLISLLLVRKKDVRNGDIEQLQNKLNRRRRVSKDCRIVFKSIYIY